MLFVNTFNCISLTIYLNFFVCLNVFNSKRINMLKTHLIYTLLLFTLGACNAQQTPTKKNIMDTTKNNNPVYSTTDTAKVVLKEDEWKKVLTPEQYYIARQKGTERAWTSKFEKSKEVGTYYCAACGNALFKSDTKFESGCGWPSFYEPISKSAVLYTPDNSHGMERTEAQCGRCKAHLGHVFEDGPPPTYLRYCINGVILDFEKAKDAEKKYNNKQ